MRVLMVVNAMVDARREREIAEGRYPRKDYLELRQATAADVLDLAALDRRIWTRCARRLAGAAVAQALLAWTLSSRYDAVFADQETTGFALAALYQLRARRRPRLTMIGHLLSSEAKGALFRALHLDRTIDAVVVHSSLQQRLAERSLGLGPNQVALVPYQTDERFWSSAADHVDADGGVDLICSVGLEYRDYDTFIAAVDGLPVEVVIAAASHWSKHEGVDAARPLPVNVKIGSYDYAALRALYARARLVAVPLQDVENQAGITTILEAMAMGKAVVVSHTRGQTDVVRDRRRANRVDQRRPTQPDWALKLGATGGAARGNTGIYVQPGDPEELRRAIRFLLEHPEQARVMGANGRQMVEESMSLDLFTRRVAAIIIGGPAHDRL